MNEILHLKWLSPNLIQGDHVNFNQDVVDYVEN